MSSIYLLFILCRRRMAPQDLAPGMTIFKSWKTGGAEGSPTRIARRKRKLVEKESSPKASADKQRPDNSSTMPPPPSTTIKSSKRQGRRKRRSSNQHVSKSGSERSSSFSHQLPTSDAPQQHMPSTPARSEATTHRAKRARVGETMLAEQTPKPSRTQATTGSQKAPSSSVKGGQRSSGGGMSGLSGLVRKAHIPTPPKVKRTPLKEKKQKLDIRAEDDESDESSDSD
jgi:hypothetical protein